MKQDKTEMVAQQDGDHQPMIIQKEEGDSGTPVLGYRFLSGCRMSGLFEQNGCLKPSLSIFPKS